MTDKENNNLIERPPVVVIMGHIDHGKSTLLDYIRKSSIVSGEAGGITQHLGAYEVEYKRENGDIKKITFIDTPGHEAFKSVRSRGAQVADIAVLIVSAEDGVMPQTMEALECIKKSKVPFVVAINKIDSPRANVDAVKNSLVENGIYIEGFGGDIPCAMISAKTGENINELLEIILLSAEIQEYRGDNETMAEGYVVEAHKDRQTGITATLVIKNGSLYQGQVVTCCDAMSPIRVMCNHRGEQIKEATFSTPISVSGWNQVPKVGSKFETFNNKKQAEKSCQEYIALERALKENKGPAKIQIKKVEEFLVPLVIKADTDGSLEAILYELNKVETANNETNAKTKIVSTGTGNISENDLKLASSDSNAIVVGFGVEIDNQAKAMADRLNIKTATFDIIYELTDWLLKTIDENRPRVETEVKKGLVKVLKVFNNEKRNQIIGGKVKEGSISSANKFKILRRGEFIGTGAVKGLQQQKSIVNEVSLDSEFGMSVESKMEIAPGDELEVFEIVKI